MHKVDTQIIKKCHMDTKHFDDRDTVALGDVSPCVVLVSLPWATYAEPSLGLAILKATLKERGIFCRVLHANLGLLRHLTSETYSMIASFWGLNEFLFTGNLDTSFDEAQAACLVERCSIQACNIQRARYANAETLIDLCMRLRDDVIPQYLRECADQILDLRPTMVGFTCMFDQTLASIALAKVLKEDAPDLLVVLGGYAMEGPAGPNVLRCFKWIDAIARGDGEQVIARLATASAGAENIDEIPGIITRQCINNGHPANRIDLDRCPAPNYDDWFADIEELQRNDHVIIQSRVLPIEASRGCWWGKKTIVHSVASMN